MSGSLTDAVLERPYSLILLDEFEKAHSGVLNLFLQVFDDGRLTDSLGRTVDFSNTIIVATSNALSEEIIERLREGEEMETFAGEFKRRLTAIFRPELINRFTEVVVFRSLSPDDIYHIAKLHLKKLARLLEDEQGVVITFSDEAIRAIAELGYSATFGARPLKNAISEHIRSQLAEMILRRKLTSGGRVDVSFTNNEFVFVVAR
jgi:ATP-dependent Clp protease ATP-binding subunit ClpB